MSVCVLASVLILISLVDMVCDLDLSVADFEVDEPQTLSVHKKGGASVSNIGTRTAQDSEHKHGNNASEDAS